MTRAAAICAGAPACAAAALACAVLWPVPREELSLAGAVSLRIEARDGTLLRELAARGEGYAAPARLEALPPHVWQAFVAAEDRRFFAHPGVDPPALARALLQDVRRGRFAQGGSTLTMQLARLMRPHARGLGGKLAEMLFALRLERALSKRQILEQYLTRVPLGNDVRGVEAAARLYFDRPAGALTPLQSALLAALPRSPAALDPLRAPERSRAAALRALRKLGGSADPGAPLDLSRERFRRAFEAPHFVEEIARRRAPPGAARVRTTLDLALQGEVERAIHEQLAGLADRRVGSAAALVIDNLSAEVLAWAGSPDWFDEEEHGRIDGVRTLRQPGSTLKPFAYAQAIERHGLTAATLLSDVESHFGDYLPRNYDRRAHGPVRARIALASSYNVPAVRVAEKVSAPELLQTLRRAGFDSLSRDADHYGLGLVLGDGEVSLLALARAYAALARGGRLPELRFVREAQDAQGRALPLPPGAERRLFSPVAAALVTDILADPAARAPAFGLDNALRFPFPAAAKTGTSRAFTDNWTVGYTRERTVAVWVGNMSGATMRHVSGITGAGTLFHRILSLAMQGITNPLPLYDAALEEMQVCALSGEAAGPHCPSAVREKFAPGTAPHARCPMHGAPGLDLGPRFYDWAAHEGVRTLSSASSGGERAALAFPRPGDEFLRGRDLPDDFQTIPVRVLAPRGGGALELQLDQGPRTELRAPFSTRIPARRGRHLLQLFRAGHALPDASASFVVDG
jgi:penicillin-binding protein 1C